MGVISLDGDGDGGVDSVDEGEVGGESEVVLTGEAEPVEVSRVRR